MKKKMNGIFKAITGVVLLLGLIFILQAAMLTLPAGNAVPYPAIDQSSQDTNLAAILQPYPAPNSTHSPDPTITPLPTHKPTAVLPNDPDSVAIQNNLSRYLELKAEIHYTLDDSRLSEVMANDSRGGLTGGEIENRFYLKAVQWHRGDPNIKSDEFGLLDFWQARYAFAREVKRIYDNSAITRGLVPTPTSNPDVSIPRRTPDPYYFAIGQLRDLPEIKALEKASGLGVTLPRPLPDKVVPDKFIFQSISIDKDIAHVIGDFSYAKDELIFAKIQGRWYLINIIELQSHF